eukprot:13832249-Ditylum_brightwellii.AAC.1
MTKRSSAALGSNTPSACLQGCQQEVGACLSPRVGQKSQVICGPTNYCPAPYHNKSSRVVGAKDPACSPRVGIEPP